MLSRIPSSRAGTAETSRTVFLPDNGRFADDTPAMPAFPGRHLMERP